MGNTRTQLYLFSADVENAQVPIDSHFDVEFADSLARLESYNKHLYRPNTYLHKWWARRCGSTFRSILKQLVANEEQRDYYSPGGLENVIILDPMMGGGTTLHEAVRMGANAIGADIDPIPVLQARASLADVPLSRLNSAFDHLLKALREELLPFYQTSCPACGVGVEVRYILHGIRRVCACGEAIVVDSLILRHNSDDSIVHLDSESHDIYVDDRLVSRAMSGSKLPIVEKKERECNRCGERYEDLVNLPHFSRYSPIAIVGTCDEHGLFFAAPQESDLELVDKAERLRRELPFAPEQFEIDAGPKSSDLLSRGVESYLDLFSSRQLLYLDTAIKALESQERIVRLNLALLISTSLEFNSMLCGYKGAGKRRPGAIRHTFAHHAYSFPYTALENNPLYPAKLSGTLENLYHSRLVRGRKWALKPVERVIAQNKTKKVIVQGEVDIGKEVREFSELLEGTRRFMLIEGSSTSLDLPDNAIDFAVTDPPYFDSVQYGDLAAFFRVWLRKLLPRDADWHYSLGKAAVDQKNGDGQYEQVLGDIFSEMHRVLKKEKGRLIFTFHHWDPEGWASLTKALRRAGFKLVNYYVVHAENPSSVHIVNQNSLVHDVVLVLAPIESSAGRKWERPGEVSLDDSRAFCEDCGAVTGWLLERPIEEEDIGDIWNALLS